MFSINYIDRREKLPVTFTRLTATLTESLHLFVIQSADGPGMDCIVTVVQQPLFLVHKRRHGYEMTECAELI